MKKSLLPIALFLLPFISSFSQTQFAFTGGYAQPLGEYASTDPSGGYAKPGYTIGIRVDNYFPSGIGVGLHIKNHKNQIDDLALQEDIKTEFGYTNTQTYYSASHKSFGFMILGSYKFLDLGQFTGDVSVGGGGALNDMTNTLLIGAGSPFLREQVYVDYNGKYSWAWHSGIRFNYYISPSVGIVASASYYGTNPTYVIAKEDFKGVESGVRTYTTINHMMDYSIGIVFGR